MIPVQRALADRRAGSPGDGPIRALVVMPLGEARGGGEDMLRQLLREGRGLGIEWIVVFLRPGPLVADIRALGVVCHVIEAGRFRQIGRRVTAVRRIAALARDADVDLVVGWMVAGQVMAGPAAWLARRPCAWYQVSTPRPDILDRAATLWPSVGVITLSRAGAEAQARMRPRRAVTLIHPGVALDRIASVAAVDPVALRARLGLPADRPVVGIVGRLQRWKGMHLFLEAVGRLRRSHPTIHAVVVGGPHETEPDYGDALRAQARALGIADAVTFAGHQTNAVEWMQAMDVVVHASRMEPFGIVIVEAMALGKPVVASGEGGPLEIITPGTDGLLVPFGDVDGIAREVARVLTDPALAQRLGRAARARAAQFSAPAYAAKVCDALRGFAGARRPAARRTASALPHDR